MPTRSIVYRAGKHSSAHSHRLSCSTSRRSDERRNWSEGSDAYGGNQTDGDGSSNHLSLRVTPNHVMYVQLGTETSGSNIAWRQQARKHVSARPTEGGGAHSGRCWPASEALRALR